MRVCPVCNQIYADDSLNFCLIDGAALRGENAAPPTVNLSENAPPATVPQTFDLPSATDFSPARNRISSTPANLTKRKWLLAVFIGTVIFSAGILFAVIFLRAEKSAVESVAPLSANENVNAANVEEFPPLTLEKYKKLETGMNYDNVVAIMGAEGIETNSTDYSTGSYQMKSRTMQWGNNTRFIIAAFVNDKLTTKSQMGLR